MLRFVHSAQEWSGKPRMVFKFMFYLYCFYYCVFFHFVFAGFRLAVFFCIHFGFMHKKFKFLENNKNTCAMIIACERYGYDSNYSISTTFSLKLLEWNVHLFCTWLNLMLLFMNTNQKKELNWRVFFPPESNWQYLSGQENRLIFAVTRKNKIVKLTLSFDADFYAAVPLRSEWFEVNQWNCRYVRYFIWIDAEFRCIRDHRKINKLSFAEEILAGWSSDCLRKWWQPQSDFGFR